MIEFQDDLEELLQKSANKNGVPFDLAISILRAELNKANMIRRAGIYNDIRHLIRKYVADNIVQLSSEAEGGDSVAD